MIGGKSGDLAISTDADHAFVEIDIDLKPAILDPKLRGPFYEGVRPDRDDPSGQAISPAQIAASTDMVCTSKSPHDPLRDVRGIDLLDAYSRAVILLAEYIGPSNAAAPIDGRRKRDY